MARSEPSILAIAASTSLSPSALVLFARASTFSSFARSLIAARSASENFSVFPAISTTSFSPNLARGASPPAPVHEIRVGTPPRSQPRAEVRRIAGPADERHPDRDDLGRETEQAVEDLLLVLVPDEGRGKPLVDRRHQD